MRVIQHNGKPPTSGGVVQPARIWTRSAFAGALAFLLAITPDYTPAKDDQEAASAADPTPSSAKEGDTTAPGDDTRLIEEAVEQLTIEAKALGQFKEEDGAIASLSRPHALVSRINPTLARHVLDRMLRPFTSNPYEDSFVRWHLMHVISQASQEDRDTMGPKLVKLIKQMPGPFDRPERREYVHIPEGIHDQWWSIFTSLRVVIGYPPYEKRINPPASFDHMDEATRAKAEEQWQKALKLKEQFKTVYDHDAIAHNRRIREVNWIVRQYRGELIYALFWTGDAEMAKLMMDSINKHARRQDGIALDLLAFWYLAAFDGALELYEPALLNELSQKLNRTARASERWIGYQLRQRNFADYAFHLIQMLKDPSFSTPSPAPTEAAEG